MRLVWRNLQLAFTVLITVVILSVVPFFRNVVMITVSPVVLLTRSVSESVFDVFRVIKAIPNLARENNDLRLKLNELSSLEIKQKELAHENELLRKELSLTSPENADKLIAAQVISRTASVSQQQLVVNKGTNDGFTKGMAIIAQGYFIGQVEESLPNSSRIELVTSVRSLIPVVLQNSRSIGLLKGGAEGLIVSEIPRDVKVDTGEAVVTANVGEVVKGGLPVGKVSLLLSGQSDVFQSARILSPIDFSRLEVVFGVK